MFEEADVREATLEYFGGDDLATNVFMTKYCLRDKKGRFLERTPDAMHRRRSTEAGLWLGRRGIRRTLVPKEAHLALTDVHGRILKDGIRHRNERGLLSVGKTEYR